MRLSILMKGPNYIHCVTGEINAVLGQMKLSTRYTSMQRFHKEIPMAVNISMIRLNCIDGNTAYANVQITPRENQYSH